VPDPTNLNFTNLVDNKPLGHENDTESKSTGVPNRLLENDFNMFFNPAQMMNYGTAYMEAWTGPSKVWGGATVNAPFVEELKIGVFLRRPFSRMSPLGSMLTDPISKKKFSYKNPGDTTFAPATGRPNNPQFGLSGLVGFGGGGDSPLSAVAPDAHKVNLTEEQFNIFGVTSNKGFGNFDFFLGYKLTSNMNLGARIGYASTTDNEESERTPPDATKVNVTKSKLNYKASQFEAGLGLQIKKLGPVMLGVGASIGFPSVAMLYEAEGFSAVSTAYKEKVTIESNSPTQISGIVRAIYPFSGMKLITAVNVDTYSMPVEIGGVVGVVGAIPTNDHKVEYKTAYTAINIDLGLHQKFDGNKLKVIYSAGFESKSVNYTKKTSQAPTQGLAGYVWGTAHVDQSNEITSNSIVVGVAIQHQTWETLSTRLGIRKTVWQPISEKKKLVTYNANNIVNYTQNKTLENEFSDSDGFLIAMGLGFMPTRKVALDFAVEASVFSLVNASQGKLGTENRSFFASLSAKYHFGAAKMKLKKSEEPPGN